MSWEGPPAVCADGCAEALTASAGLGMATASSGVGAGGLWRDEGAEQVFERIQVQKESPQERFGVLHVTFLVAR